MATLTADVGSSDVLWHVSARIPQSVPFLEAGSEVVAILGWSMPGAGGHDDPLRIWVQRGVAGSTPAAHLSAAPLTPIYSQIGSPQLNAGSPGAVSVTDGVTTVAASTIHMPGAVSDAGGGVAKVGLLLQLLGPFHVVFGDFGPGGGNHPVELQPLSVGQIVLDAWVEVTEAWDNTT